MRAVTLLPLFSVLATPTVAYGPYTPPLNETNVGDPPTPPLFNYEAVNQTIQAACNAFVTHEYSITSHVLYSVPGNITRPPDTKTYAFVASLIVPANATTHKMNKNACNFAFWDSVATSTVKDGISWGASVTTEFAYL